MKIYVSTFVISGKQQCCYEQMSSKVSSTYEQMQLIYFVSLANSQTSGCATVLLLWVKC